MRTTMLGLIYCVTVSKMSKNRVFSGPYFPVFELNTEIYPVTFCASFYLPLHQNASAKLSIFSQFSVKIIKSRFQKKRVFVKLATFFIWKNKQNFTKSSNASASALKIIPMFRWTFFEMLLVSAVICKQSFVWKRDCTIYLKLQSYDVNKGHFIPYEVLQIPWK